MRAIVTGGAGFIGSALARHLVEVVGAEVLTIDKLTYAGNLANLEQIAGKPNYQFLLADICDAAAMRNAIKSYRPTKIFHLAAESHVDRSITGSSTFIQTNIVGTFTLLEATCEYWHGLQDDLKRDFRLLHISTDEVFGSLGSKGAFTEKTAYDPSSPYSASKAAADHLIKAWHRTYGLPAIVSNCSNNYGPFHFPEKLIPLTILNALHNKALPVYGDGSNVRDWLYVDDHARALHLIAERGRPGETYNVGGKSEKRNIDVVHTVCSTLDRLAPKSFRHSELITFVPDRPGHDARYAIDCRKLEVELGWRACETFSSGIEKTVGWFLENEKWWRPIRDKIYAGERLGMPAN